MSRLRLHTSGGDDDAPETDPQDTLTRELRALYAAPGERYWDDLEGKILAAVRASAAAPARAAHWWQTMADWARPGLAAAAVLVAVVGATTLQSRATRSSVAGADAAKAVELQPLDPELARAFDDALRADTASAREAQEAAYLLTGGVKQRGPVRLDETPVAPTPAPPRTGAPARDARSADDADDVQRARREATFRYVMPD
ncbi:hypothetical protein [Roseisolibacter sp. H3M3-2]|uniref:hypothetical protein n=1 Tax=Roseisolibacter sp. H3M3-2 TaxID=3031323 RepID=UPI0023DAFF29|nr:hypothetical protein [Roseisolibacter sp. H3M3-2]MDF1503794.1 hypothetical protein [Roseisolibacter sp. H3M3-2]